MLGCTGAGTKVDLGPTVLPTSLCCGRMLLSVAGIRPERKYGGTAGEVLRYVLFSCWIECFMQGSKHFDDLRA
jgi:hypothetical protein